MAPKKLESLIVDLIKMGINKTLKAINILD